MQNYIPRSLFITNPRLSALDIVMEALHKEDKETAKKKR